MVAIDHMAEQRGEGLATIQLNHYSAESAQANASSPEIGQLEML